MARELLEIEPRELKFVFELKKQSSCSIQLGNKCDQCVAFKVWWFITWIIQFIFLTKKFLFAFILAFFLAFLPFQFFVLIQVKTTSPRKYCVRPNTGIIKPKERIDFTVTMQAQHMMPPDMQCKDKFLIQSTIVPSGTTEEDITSDMFSKDSGKYIEEKKLRVVLISSPSSPVLLPVNREMKQDPCNENQLQKYRVLHGVENIPPPLRVAENLNCLGTAKDMVSRPDENVVDKKVKNGEDMKPTKDDAELNLSKDSKELKSELSVDSRLKEAKLIITKLTEERSTSTQERDMLKYELEVLKRKSFVRRVLVGFPLLYVCLVALISMAVGYYFHP